MDQGIEREADAFDLYEVMTGRCLFKVGYLEHPSLRAGASLDGAVNDLEGIVEIKSPMPATHLEYLETGIIPGDYLKQIAHALYISGADWCDWMSYNPDFPEPLRAKVVRVQRDLVKVNLGAYDGLLRAFLAEVDAKEAKVRTMIEKASAA